MPKRKSQSGTKARGILPIPYDTSPYYDRYLSRWLNRKKYEDAIRCGAVPPYFAGRILRGLPGGERLFGNPLKAGLRYQIYPGLLRLFDVHRTELQIDRCDCCSKVVLADGASSYFTFCECDHPYLFCVTCLQCSKHHDTEHVLANQCEYECRPDQIICPELEENLRDGLCYLNMEATEAGN